MLNLAATVLFLAAQEHGVHGDPSRPQEKTVVELVRPMNASGTSWQPSQTPHVSMHSQFQGWDFMTSAALFGVFDFQTGERGDDRFMSTNWIMLSASRPLGGGEFSLRGMASIEAITVGDRGYPLLLQNGEGLHDSQHPHDLVMELAAAWTAPVSRSLGVQFYGGVVGEPALGPVAFPHRHSAASDPMAPLGHHWQDSTHISPGVLTAGLFTTFAKLEASWFNGREPDDNRLDLDFDAPDSGSVRLTVNPDPLWSFQISAGRLDEPEEDEPGISVFRTTASATATGKVGGEGAWSGTAIWGRNDPSDGETTDSYLAEANVELNRTHAIFGRAEYVRKTGHDLDLGAALDDDVFPVPSLSLGYLYTFTELQAQEVSMGVRITANFIDRDLQDFYGDPVEWGVAVFLRLRPSRAK